MPIDNISRLSRKLLATCLATDGKVTLDHKTYLADTCLLSDSLRDEVNSLVEKLRSLIPTDFAFDLFFEMEGVTLSLSFEDGNTVSTAGRNFFTSQKSLMRSIRHAPWDEMRSDLINKGGIFDEMVSAAADRPVSIPSSEASAKRYGILLVAEIGKNRRLNPRSPFTLIIGRDDLGICSEQFSSREDLVTVIADRMTTQNDILAVLEVCTPWTFEEVEAAKLEAVEQLGPISRAKAERRFNV